MIKFVLIFIVLAYCDTELISQSKVYGTVCNIRGVEYSKKKDETIEIPLGKEHWIYKYLKKLTDLLEPEKRGFFICSENDSKNAKAFRKVMYDDNESIQKRISIDFNFFESLGLDSIQKDALYIFILAHEMEHHLNEDLDKDDPRRIVKYKRELVADEKAGYLVGKFVHPQILNPNFLDVILNKFLNKTSFSDKYPSKTYRVMAAKAGWLRGLCESTNERFSFKIDSNERNFTRVPVNNWGVEKNQRDQIFENYILRGFEIDTCIRLLRDNKSKSFNISEFTNNLNKNGITLNMNYNEEGLQQIDFLNYHNDSLINGLYVMTIDGCEINLLGTNSELKHKLKNYKCKSSEILIKEGDNRDQQNVKYYTGLGFMHYDENIYYEGYFKDNLKNGKGILYENGIIFYEGFFLNNLYEGKGKYYFPNGQYYYGEWKKGKKNGIGFIYNSKKECIKFGCWIDDNYFDTECKD